MLRAGDLELDTDALRARRRGVEVTLTPKEAAVLATLMREAGRPVARATLVASAWSGEYQERSNVVDACVCCLRGKIDRPFGVESIATVKGVGYVLRTSR